MSKSWTSCTVDDVRLGNVVSFGAITDEVVAKAPPVRRDDPNSIYLVTREHGPYNLLRDEVVEVYR